MDEKTRIEAEVEAALETVPADQREELEEQLEHDLESKIKPHVVMVCPICGLTHCGHNLPYAPRVVEG